MPAPCFFSLSMEQQGYSPVESKTGIMADKELIVGLIMILSKLTMTKSKCLLFDEELLIIDVLHHQAIIHQNLCLKSFPGSPSALMMAGSRPHNCPLIAIASPSNFLKVLPSWETWSNSLMSPFWGSYFLNKPIFEMNCEHRSSLSWWALMFWSFRAMELLSFIRYWGLS